MRIIIPEGTKILVINEYGNEEEVCLDWDMPLEDTGDLGEYIEMDLENREKYEFLGREEHEPCGMEIRKAELEARLFPN